MVICESPWVKAIHDLDVQPSQNLARWLQEPFNLSHAIKKVVSSFNIYVISEGFCSLMDDEALLFGVEEEGFVRQVYLKNGLTPLCFGRVAMPWQTFERHSEKIQQIGSNPFGETVLYSCPDLKRTPFEYLYLEEGDLHSVIFDSSTMLESSPVWGRRSLFHLNEMPLLISEFFLPNMPEFPNT